VSCWPHKPCEWRSTRQPATSFRESRSTGGPLACNQQMGVRFPPLPPRFVREAVAVKAPARNAGQARSTRAPDTKCDRGRVAQACDCESLHESSILSGHPILREVKRCSRVAQMAERRALNAEAEGSRPSPAARIVLPGFRARRSTDQDAGLRTQRLEVRILPRVPISARRPRERAQSSEGWNSGSTPDGPAKFMRSVDRLARCPAVDRDEASSILVRSAKRSLA
jgi:hypothetical protein